MDTNLLLTTRSSVIGLLRDGLLERAVQMEQKALDLAEDQYGLLHPALVPIFDDLGTLYSYRAEYPESQAQYRWGLAIRERILGVILTPMWPNPFAMSPVWIGTSPIMTKPRATLNGP